MVYDPDFFRKARPGENMPTGGTNVAGHEHAEKLKKQREARWANENKPSGGSGQGRSSSGGGCFIPTVVGIAAAAVAVVAFGSVLKDKIPYGWRTFFMTDQMIQQEKDDFFIEDGKVFYSQNAMPALREDPEMTIHIVTKDGQPGVCRFVDEDGSPINSIPQFGVVEFVTDTEGAGFFTANQWGVFSTRFSTVGAMPAGRNIPQYTPRLEFLYIDDENFWREDSQAAYGCFDSEATLEALLASAAGGDIKLQASSNLDIVPVVYEPGKLPEGVDIQAFEGTPYKKHLEASAVSR